VLADLLSDHKEGLSFGYRQSVPTSPGTSPSVTNQEGSDLDGGLVGGDARLLAEQAALLHPLL
jgi:hypothetical protein